jgi:hypothetical protein
VTDHEVLAIIDGLNNPSMAEPTPFRSLYLQLQRELYEAERNGCEVDRLRMDKRTCEKIQMHIDHYERLPVMVTPGQTYRLEGHEVEVVEGLEEVMDVVVTTADVRELVAV